MSRGGQLGLFGDPPWPEELTKLGERIPSHVRLGTSSWTFEGSSPRTVRALAERLIELGDE